jgi:dextranase
VSNYPVHATAGAKQDVVYIEVWDPVTGLGDIRQIIDWARMLSGRQVVLAAYLPAFHPEYPANPQEAEIGATVAMAVIFASGGYHLLIGENGNVLTEGYYPKYGRISAAFANTLQGYYDYIVMYRELLFDLRLEDISMTFAGGINTEIVVAVKSAVCSPHPQLGGVWLIAKEKPGYLVIHLLNLCGLDNKTWHAAKRQAPRTLTSLSVKAEIWEQVEAVWWSSPDCGSIRPQPLDWRWVPKGDGNDAEGYCVSAEIPRLEYWSTLVIRTRQGVPASIANSRYL